VSVLTECVHIIFTASQSFDYVCVLSPATSTETLLSDSWAQWCQKDAHVESSCVFWEQFPYCSWSCIICSRPSMPWSVLLQYLSY